MIRHICKKLENGDVEISEVEQYGDMTIDLTGGEPKIIIPKNMLVSEKRFTEICNRVLTDYPKGKTIIIDSLGGLI